MLSSLPRRQISNLRHLSTITTTTKLPRLVPVDPPIILHKPTPSTTPTFAYTHEFKSAPKNLPTFVCLHGGPGSHRDFRYISAALIELQTKGHAVPQLIRVDLPGYGKSDCLENGALPSALNLSKFVLERLDDIVGDGKDKLVFIGHSLGGHAAVEASVLSPKTAGLVLINPLNITAHKALGNSFWPLQKAFTLLFRVPILKGVMGKLALKGFEYAGFKNTSEDEVVYTQIRVGCVDFARTKDLIKEIEGDLLMVFTKDDHLIQVSKFEELYEYFVECHGEDRAKKLVFETGGHNPQRSRAREIALDLLLLADKLGHKQ